MGAPVVPDQMFWPGLPMPCMANSWIISRANSVPLAVRHTPPKPPRMPEPPMVLVEAQRRASALMSAAGIPVSRSAHLGVLGRRSVPLPRI